MISSDKNNYRCEYRIIKQEENTINVVLPFGVLLINFAIAWMKRAAVLGGYANRL